MNVTQVTIEVRIERRLMEYCHNVRSSVGDTYTTASTAAMLCGVTTARARVVLEKWVREGRIDRDKPRHTVYYRLDGLMLGARDE